MSHFRCRAMSLLCLTAALPAPLLAQDAPPPDASADAAKAPVGKRTFTPADFTQFAPKTAMDMIDQLPSFTVRSTDSSRGLGQASENVLINGQRVTDKSGGAVDRLRNVPAADVLRIEVQEAAVLGIPGLSGEVANVILKENRKASGRIEWSPRVRPDYAKPALLRGKITYTGNVGDIGYTVGLQNYGNRGAIGGPDYVVMDAQGTVTEQRNQHVQFVYDNTRFSTLLKYGEKGPVQANLNLIYNPYWQRSMNSQRRERTDDRDNNWLTRGRTSGFTFSASGDLSFPLVGGTLKMIGVRSYEHAPFLNTQRTDYDGPLPDEGVRFGRDSRTGETIGRIEYHWKGGKNDWEFSLERAYNRLDQRGSLAILQPDGVFQDTPFSQGSGVVAEKRYEAILSLSRPLSGKLDLQLVGGGELSRLRHVDRPAEPERRFFRPKGSISLAWRPSKGWDASLKLERKVGQINFADFLAQADLVLGKQNGANPDLVPPQSWQASGEIGRNFGAWGKTRLRVYRHRIEDIVDIIPIGTSDQAVGNLPKASRFGIESISTIQFDPIGWKGAKVDITVGGEHTSVRDPLTGSRRPITNTRDFWSYVNLRHDIPGSQVAWGAYFSVDHFGSSYYLNEINRNWEGPYFGLFVEHKNLAGMKVSFDAFNITDARNHFDRTVYGGRRNISPIIFREQQRQRVSQIFTLTVTKTF